MMWYRVPRLRLTSQPNLTITKISPVKLSLLMWNVSPGHQYLGQYKCVATNSVTTSEAVINFTGEARQRIDIRMT